MFSTKTTKLTTGEEEFIAAFLADNGCGAQTPEQLLGDNFSCQCITDLVELFKEKLNKHQIAGFISSLEAKGVLWIEDRKDEGLPWEKLPDLYWVSDSYLEELDPQLKFY